jgi:hypothetical protein
MRFAGFIGPSYTLQSVNVDCQRCVNLYPELNELGTGKEGEVAALVPTPGLRLLATIGDGPIRGMFRASNDEVFVVSGSKLYQVSSAWAGTLLGTLNTSSGHVSMADNGTYLMIVDGTNGYTFNMSTDSFLTVSDPEFQTADQVTFLDGYFLFNAAGTQNFFFSGLNAVTFDGLDVAGVEGSPDHLVGLIANNQNVYLFGKQSTEVFQNTGDSDNPFQRIGGAVITAGCAAPFSIAKIGGSVFWLGGDESGSGVVYRTQGYQAVRISTPAIESVIRGLTATQIEAAKGWTYQQGGHLFYVLNIPGASSTWVYDAATSMWHERTYSGLFGEARHRGDCHALAHGLNVVGDYEDGKLYALDPEKYTDNGTVITRTRTAPHLTRELRRVFHNKFELDMETGVGLDGTGQGTDPQAMLQWSNDGGHTWSDELWRDIGAIGQRKTRVIWRRLGSARDRVYRVKITEPVKVVLIGADLQMEEGVA